MDNTTYDIAIIGAGIVGSALARELSQRFPRILVLEKESQAAEHTSGRNSGVVHSGFNPTPGTLKARLCVEGNALIHDYCLSHNVPYKQVGTLVVAHTDDQIPALEMLLKKGEKNGVPGLTVLAESDLKKKEPAAKGKAALFSPSGALVDAKALTRSIAKDAQRSGSVFHFNHRVTGLQETSEGIHIQTAHSSFNAKLVINCGGLYADQIAHQIGVGLSFSIAPFRGEYFVIRRPIIQSMLYSPPDPRFPFLGIHLTQTIQGDVLVGPNAVPAFGREAYRTSDFSLSDLWDMIRHPGFWNAFWHNRALVKVAWKELHHSFSPSHFLEEASHLVDGLSLNDLEKTPHVGIRPQLLRDNGELVEDLVIEHTPHSIHILNMISPGMTCSLSFAKWISTQISDDLHWSASAS